MRRLSFFSTLFLLILTPGLAHSFGAAVVDLGVAKFDQNLDGPRLNDTARTLEDELIIQVAQRTVNKRIPQFESFPAKRYFGPVRAPNLKSHPDARTYRTRLRNAAKGDVSFAGEYAMATWGCGAGCIMGAAINARTGNVVFLPGTLCCWERDEDNIMDYRLDSRLLIMRGSIDEQDPVGAHYYELKNGKFQLILTLPVAATPPLANLPRVNAPSSNTRTLSSAKRVPSAGSDTDVTDYTLINDTNVDLTIRWLNGQAEELPPYDAQQTPADQWVSPDEVWQISNGAKTWESHWYAVFTRDGFVCSFSPRQGEQVRFSQLSACQVGNVVSQQEDEDFAAPIRLEDNRFAVGTYSSDSAPSGNIEMDPSTFSLTWTEFCGPTIRLSADWSFGQLTATQPTQRIFELDISDVGDVTGFQDGRHIYVKEDGIMMPGCVGTSKPKISLPKPNIPKPNLSKPKLPKANIPNLQQTADDRSQNDYSLVQPAMYQVCAEKFPNSPADDKWFYDCMDQALMNSLEELEDAGSN